MLELVTAHSWALARSCFTVLDAFNRHLQVRDMEIRCFSWRLSLRLAWHIPCVQGRELPYLVPSVLASSAILPSGLFQATAAPARRFLSFEPPDSIVGTGSIEHSFGLLLSGERFDFEFYHTWQLGKDDRSVITESTLRVVKGTASGICPAKGNIRSKYALAYIAQHLMEAYADRALHHEIRSCS